MDDLLAEIHFGARIPFVGVVVVIIGYSLLYMHAVRTEERINTRLQTPP